jgi:hypothetical protein
MYLFLYLVKLAVKFHGWNGMPEHWIMQKRNKMSKTYERYTVTKKLTPLPRPFACSPPREVSHKNIQWYEPDLTPEAKQVLHDCLRKMLLYLDPVLVEDELDIDLINLVYAAEKVMKAAPGIYEAIRPVRAYINDADMTWEALKKAEQPGSTLRPEFWRSKFRESVKHAGVACQALLKE